MFVHLHFWYFPLPKIYFFKIIIINLNWRSTYEIEGSRARHYRSFITAILILFSFRNEIRIVLDTKKHVHGNVGVSPAYEHGANRCKNIFKRYELSFYTICVTFYGCFGKYLHVHSVCDSLHPCLQNCECNGMGLFRKQAWISRWGKVW